MKKLIAFLSIIVVLSSCEKDVHIDLPKKDPKLVINGVIAKDSAFSISVGKSRGVLDPLSGGNSIDSWVVKNAVVVVYENGNVLDTLFYEYGQGRYTSKHQAKVQLGKVYTVKANAPGFTEAEATTTVPSQSAIANVTRTKNARTDVDGNPEDEITIKLNDPSEKNFYLIQFSHATYGNMGMYPVYCVNTPEKDIEPIGDNADPFSTDNCYDGANLLVSDVNFNGKEKQLRFYINSSELYDVTGPGGQTNKPFVKVLRITEEQFKYIKSYNVYNNSSDNPFAEPANVFTNVKNGFGIFAAFTEAKADL